MIGNISGNHLCWRIEFQIRLQKGFGPSIKWPKSKNKIDQEKFPTEEEKKVDQTQTIVGQASRSTHKVERTEGASA